MGNRGAEELRTWRLPLTLRLSSALKTSRHLRSARVFCLADGTPITRDRVIEAIRGAQRVAGLPQSACTFWGIPSVRIWR
jgi:hypothetical protein